MGEKRSTIILKVDLDCHKCYKKISKTICKLQERENIQTVAFDEKNNTVTISGPFDPKKLIKKLCSKACKVIKDIQIEENEGKEKEKEKETEKPNETKAAEPADSSEPAKNKPKDPEPEKEKTKVLAPEPPAEEPVKIELVCVAQAPELGYEPGWPSSSCGCGCRTEGYYADYRCCWCGRGYGWASEGLPRVVYGAPVGGYKTCEFFYEEDPQPSCSIM